MIQILGLLWARRCSELCDEKAPSQGFDERLFIKQKE